jgi:hypothetical protein
MEGTARHNNLLRSKSSLEHSQQKSETHQRVLSQKSEGLVDHSIGKPSPWLATVLAYFGKKSFETTAFEFF